MAIKLLSTWDTATTSTNGVTTGAWGQSEFPVGLPERMEVSTVRSRSGAQSVKLRLEKTDPEATYGNMRVEFVHNAIDVNRDPTHRWWRWSSYLPSATYENDAPEEIFAQWHDRPTGGRSGSTNPSLALMIDNGNLFIQIRYSTADYITTPASRVTVAPNIGTIPIPKDQWNDWVVYYDPKTDSTGRVKVWMNGAVVLDYTGECAYIGSVFPYWKLGLYKWQWQVGWAFEQSTTTLREFWLDEVAVGDGDESYMSMALPGTSVSMGDINEGLGRTRNAASTSFSALRALSTVPAAASLGALIGASKAKTVVDITTTGTWTCPAGVTEITVECRGGGGGGGRATGNPSAGGGGAGGAYARKVLAVTPGNNYTVTIGAGGSGTTPSAGGDTWFSTSGTVIAKGGAVGGSATANSTNGTGGVGSTTGCIGDVVFRGGSGGNGVFTASSGRGGGGGATGNFNYDGEDAVGGTRGSGITPGGSGGQGPSDNTVGAAGSNYGGGGSGGKANNATDRNGGNGAPGHVRITY